MAEPTVSIPEPKLLELGLTSSQTIHYQLTPEELTQDTIRRGEGQLTNTGALLISTGKFTGRSPKDKFTVKDEFTEKIVNWNDFNIPLEEKYFEIIYQKVRDYMKELPEVWVRDCYACADSRYRLHVRSINEKPWNNLFVYNMFLRPTEEELENFEPDWHVIAVPGLNLNPAECGIRQQNVSLVSFKHKMILIAGTGYTGETKKRNLYYFKLYTAAGKKCVEHALQCQHG